MLKMFRSLFKSYTGPNQAARQIDNPKQLQVGDLFKMSDSFALPSELRGESFQVQQVATYFYTDIGVPEFVIKSGPNKPLFLSIEDFDGEEQLILSRKLKRKEVEALFGWDAVKELTTRETTTEIVPRAPGEDEWLADAYHRRVFGGTGRYFERDLRDGPAPGSGGEPLHYYEFYDAEERCSFEVEAWEGDELEVCIGLVRPFSDIVEYWPHS